MHTNSKWIITLQTMKLLEENCYDLRLGWEFLDIAPIPQLIKGWIDKLGFVKIKTSVLQQAPLRTKRYTRNWEKILAKQTSDIGRLDSEQIKNSQNVIKQRRYIRNEQMICTDISLKEDL